MEAYKEFIIILRPYIIIIITLSIALFINNKKKYYNDGKHFTLLF